MSPFWALSAVRTASSSIPTLALAAAYRGPVLQSQVCSWPKYHHDNTDFPTVEAQNGLIVIEFLSRSKEQNGTKKVLREKVPTLQAPAFASQELAPGEWWLPRAPTPQNYLIWVTWDAPAP